MAQKTNTIKTSPVHHSVDLQDEAANVLAQDLKNSVLIVSLVINLTILTVWIATQVTSQYNAQLAGLLNL